jgi:hypothetical protein
VKNKYKELNSLKMSSNKTIVVTGATGAQVSVNFD